MGTFGDFGVEMCSEIYLASLSRARPPASKGIGGQGQALGLGHAKASDLSGAAASPPAPPAKAGRATAEGEHSAITGKVKRVF